MPRPLDPQIGEVLKRHGFDSRAVWDCHGTWVVLHKVLEQIAAKEKIEFAQPFAIENDSERQSYALCVTGQLGDRTEWSIGECRVNFNYKVSGKQAGYPWAMAEKRAKDRVILKLIGLHGIAYSEEEADEFKQTEAPPKDSRDPNWKGPLTKIKLSKHVQDYAEQFANVSSEDDLAIIVGSPEYQELVDQCKHDMPVHLEGTPDDPGLRALYKEARTRVKQMAEFQP